LEPPPEEDSSSKPATSSSQVELELGLAQIPPYQLGMPAGHLLFCPKCMQTRDHTGQLVQLEQCLANYSEIVVIREICPMCTRFN
jgi:hypothetical protein